MKNINMISVCFVSFDAPADEKGRRWRRRWWHDDNVTTRTAAAAAFWWWKGGGEGKGKAASASALALDHRREVVDVGVTAQEQKKKNKNKMIMMIKMPRSTTQKYKILKVFSFVLMARTVSDGMLLIIHVFKTLKLDRNWYCYRIYCDDDSSGNSKNFDDDMMVVLMTINKFFVRFDGTTQVGWYYSDNPRI